jgi:hypothetical protein
MSGMDKWCDNFPDWGGCECELAGGHEGPHVCPCGARWDDDGRPLDREGHPTGLALPRVADRIERG